MEDESEKCRVERAIGKRRLLAVFDLKCHARIADAFLRDLHHSRSDVGRNYAARLAREKSRKETSTAAKSHRPTERPFTRQPVAQHVPGFPAELLVDDAVVLPCDSRPEVGVFGASAGHIDLAGRIVCNLP